jgi:hypothetical protein
MKNTNRAILLIFDVEEFDLPLEYTIPISIKEQMVVGKKGLDNITECRELFILKMGLQKFLFQFLLIFLFLYSGWHLKIFLMLILKGSLYKLYKRWLFMTILSSLGICRFR